MRHPSSLHVCLAVASLGIACAESHEPRRSDMEGGQDGADAITPASGSDLFPHDSGQEAQPSPDAAAKPASPSDASLDAALGDAGSDEPLMDAGRADGEAPRSEPGCVIEAHTDATGAIYRGSAYGCAIWITDSSDSFVRALFRAARVPKFLPSPYVSAVSGVRQVDVITGATARGPVDHVYTWPFIDNDGGLVPPGKYNLKVATISIWDAAVEPVRGDLVSVPFDTSQLPLSEVGTPYRTIQAVSIHCSAPMELMAPSNSD